jgi:hypothetical protein
MYECLKNLKEEEKIWNFYLDSKIFNNLIYSGI